MQCVILLKASYRMALCGSVCCVLATSAVAWQDDKASSVMQEPEASAVVAQMLATMQALQSAECRVVCESVTNALQPRPGGVQQRRRQIIQYYLFDDVGQRLRYLQWAAGDDDPKHRLISTRESIVHIGDASSGIDIAHVYPAGEIPVTLNDPIEDCRFLSITPIPILLFAKNITDLRAGALSTFRRCEVRNRTDETLELVTEFVAGPAKVCYWLDVRRGYVPVRYEFQVVQRDKITWKTTATIETEWKSQAGYMVPVKVTRTHHTASSDTTQILQVTWGRFNEEFSAEEFAKDALQLKRGDLVFDERVSPAVVMETVGVVSEPPSSPSIYPSSPVARFATLRQPSRRGSVADGKRV